MFLNLLDWPGYKPQQGITKWKCFENFTYSSWQKRKKLISSTASSLKEILLVLDGTLWPFAKRGADCNNISLKLSMLSALCNMFLLPHFIIAFSNFEVYFHLSHFIIICETLLWGKLKAKNCHVFSIMV